MIAIITRRHIVSAASRNSDIAGEKWRGENRDESWRIKRQPKHARLINLLQCNDFNWGHPRFFNQ